MPEQENVVTGNNVKVQFGKNTFYDAVPFVLTENNNTNKNAASDLIGLHNYTVPVHESFIIQVKTNLAVNNNLRNHVVMQLVSGTTKRISKGTWNGD